MIFQAIKSYLTKLKLLCNCTETALKLLWKWEISKKEFVVFGHPRGSCWLLNRSHVIVTVDGNQGNLQLQLESMNMNWWDELNWIE